MFAGVHVGQGLDRGYTMAGAADRRYSGGARQLSRPTPTPPPTHRYRIERVKMWICFSFVSRGNPEVVWVQWREPTINHHLSGRVKKCQYVQVGFEYSISISGNSYTKIIPIPLMSIRHLKNKCLSWYKV